jgi:hypothetical protein
MYTVVHNGKIMSSCSPTHFISKDLDEISYKETTVKVVPHISFDLHCTTVKYKTEFLTSCLGS